MESVQSWIVEHQQLWNGGPVFNFAIQANSGGQLIGMVEANTDYRNIAGLIEGDANAPTPYTLMPEDTDTQHLPST